MNNVWKNMNTGDLYTALLSQNPKQALEDLARAKRALNLTANRARIKSGHRLMNEFHKNISRIVEDYQCDYGKNYIAELRGISDSELLENIETSDLTALIRDYMEYCCD